MEILYFFHKQKKIDHRLSVKPLVYVQEEKIVIEMNFHTYSSFLYSIFVMERKIVP